MAGGQSFPNNKYCGKYLADEGGPSGLQDDFMDVQPLDFSVRRKTLSMMIDHRGDSDSDDQDCYSSNNTGARPKTRTSPASDPDELKYAYRSRPRSCSPYPVFDPYALQGNQAFQSHMPEASSSPPASLSQNISAAQLAQFQNPTALLALQTLMQSRNALEKQTQGLYPYMTPRNSPSPPTLTPTSGLTSTSGLSSALPSTSSLPSMSSLSSSLPSMSALSASLPSTSALSSGLPSTSGLYGATSAYGMRASNSDDERILRDNSFETDGLDNGLRNGMIAPGRIMSNVPGSSSGRKLEGLGNVGGALGTSLAALGYRGPPHYGYLTGTKAEVEINCTSHANYLRFREEMLKQVHATKARRSNRADRNAEEGERSHENGVGNPDGIEGAIGEDEGAVGGGDAEGTVGGAVMNEQGADGLIDNEGRVGNDNDNSRGNGRGRGRQGVNNVVKDEAYWERRRRNNEAAKRSRDARRAKEDETAIRAAFLEQENLQLKIELSTLKASVPKYEKIAYN